jgi:hypothetical protein
MNANQKHKDTSAEYEASGTGSKYNYNYESYVDFLKIAETAYKDDEWSSRGGMRTLECYLETVPHEILANFFMLVLADRFNKRK